MTPPDFRSNGVEVATYFAIPLMNVANGSMSLPGQKSAHFLVGAPAEGLDRGEIGS